MPELRFKTVSSTIEHLRSQHGNNSAVVGIGPAGEHLMPLAGVFSSYPPGEPQYFVVRGGMGDIFGSKGLKAISISSKNEFSADVSDKNRFMKASRALNAIILNHPVCGKALPSYGSITLMRMLKDGSSFEENTENAQATEDNHPVSKANGQKKINRACSTNCPISCLNRQKTGKASLFNSPFDSEAFAASKNLFGIDDQEFVISLNKQCFELGLDSIEFLFSCAMIFKIFEYHDTIGGLHSLLKEVEGATSFGRIIGSTSKGIFQLFADYKELKPMVTKAATSEESSFLIKLPNRVPGLEQISDLEYLYAYILGAQNIGMCLFTTFAVLDKPEGLELLAQMVSTKIGREFSAFDIINSGYKSLIEERAYDLEGKKAGSLSNIPEFVKVLYRYFGRANNG
ncbi:MAG: aldehyde ferredoxin oxidoreductase C-terminal domain-containing protein [Dehalococcoidales bacterium]